MKFIPFAELTAEQKTAAAKRWESVTEAHEYQFSKAGAAVARRAVPKSAKPPKSAVVPPAESKPEEKKKRPAKTPPAEPTPAAPAEPVEDPASAAPSAPPVAERIVSVPLACMEDSPTQPRTHYDQKEHEELTASMREHGWIPSFPALLRPIAGPGFLALPDDPNEPEGSWVLCHPVSNSRLFGGDLGTGKFPREEAERLAATKYAKRYEIVFAHRRSRAARAADLEDAPAVIRELSNLEVLELQLIENAQRSDLNAIEQAEHFARLLALRDEHGKPVHTRETLARRVGKDADFVRNTVLLCRLEGAEREAVANGTLGVAIAYEVARIPDAEVRALAVREILNPSEGEGPLRYRAALDFIRRKCTRNLRTEAKFAADDPELVPARFRVDLDSPDGTSRYFGGSCVGCPFNSASAATDPRTPKLGICGNIACFDAKQTAGFEKWRAEHHAPEKGKIAVTAERNAELFDEEGEVDWKTGMVSLNDPLDSGLLKAGVVFEGDAPTFRDLTKGKLTEVLIARDPKTGKKVEVIDVEKAKAAAELNGHAIFKTSKAPRARNDDEHKTQTLATKRQQEINHRTKVGLLATLAAKATAVGHLPPAAVLILAQWCLGTAEAKAVAEVESRRKLQSGELGDHLATISTAELLGVTMEVILADYYAFGCDDGASELLEVFGISLEDIAKTVAAQVDAEMSPAPAPADNVKTDDPPLPQGDGWRALQFTRRELVSAFEFNEHGVCEKPDTLEILLPTGKKDALKVHLSAACAPVEGKGAWFAGHILDGKSFSSSAPVAGPSIGAPSFPTRFGAFAEGARIVSARLDAEERVTPKVRNAMRELAAAMVLFAEAEEWKQNERAGEQLTEAVGSLVEDTTPPTFIAFLYDDGCQAGDFTPHIEEYSATRYAEALADPELYWLCAIAAVTTESAARAAAVEALSEGAGEITLAGARAGFAIHVGADGKPAPVMVNGGAK